MVGFNQYLMNKIIYKLYLIMGLLLIGLSQGCAQSQKTISGQIIDPNGQVIPGATIMVKGTSTAITTDFDGKFTLTVKKGDTLTVSYVGFTAEDLEVDDANNYLLMVGAEQLRYWCCTSHHSPKHCAANKEDLEHDGLHNTDERYERTN